MASLATGGDYRAMAATSANRYGIPVPIFDALVQTESAYDPNARGRAGEIGLAQLMPSTALQLKVNPWNPAENLTGAAAYLRQQFDRFGSWTNALAAYNGGPGGYLGTQAQGYARKVLDAAALVGQGAMFGPAAALGATAGVLGNAASASADRGGPAPEVTANPATWFAWLSYQVTARAWDLALGLLGLVLIVLGVWFMFTGAPTAYGVGRAAGAAFRFAKGTV